MVETRALLEVADRELDLGVSAGWTDDAVPYTDAERTAIGIEQTRNLT